MGPRGTTAISSSEVCVTLDELNKRGVREEEKWSSALLLCYVQFCRFGSFMHCENGSPVFADPWISWWVRFRDWRCRPASYWSLLSQMQFDIQYLPVVILGCYVDCGLFWEQHEGPFIINAIGTTWCMDVVYVNRFFFFFLLACGCKVLESSSCLCAPAPSS